MSDSARASLRSQGGSGAGLPFTTCPTCLVTRLEPRVFRILLLRRLRLLLPFTVRSCRCGLPLNSCGHHRAACAQAGVLGRRGWALESVAARICREAGGRVTTNVLLRDFVVEMPNVADGPQLEVVADGLPLFGGVQLAIDTTLVCALRRDGNPTHNAAIEDGAALRQGPPTQGQNASRARGATRTRQAGCPRHGSGWEVVRGGLFLPLPTRQSTSPR